MGMAIDVAILCAVERRDLLLYRAERLLAHRCVPCREAEHRPHPRHAPLTDVEHADGRDGGEAEAGGAEEPDLAKRAEEVAAEHRAERLAEAVDRTSDALRHMARGSTSREQRAAASMGWRCEVCAALACITPCSTGTCEKSVERHGTCAASRACSRGLANCISTPVTAGRGSHR